MTPLSQEILKNWQVRKTKKQKSAFIEFMQGHFPEMTVEQGGFGGNRNMVIGDPASAKVILTAHYDTCARLPFPNFITPLNIWLYLGYQILIIIPFLLLFAAAMWAFTKLGLDFFFGYYLSFLIMFGTLIWMFMLGPANPHTANDNTSGVIQLCEIYAALTQEQKKQVCFVFFDNEENGLLGSMFFFGKHKKEGIRDKLLLNFDCVSDGDNILIAINKKVKKQYGDKMEQSFLSEGGKNVMVTTKAFYPSDQTNSSMGVGIAALKKAPLVGYYMDRIHTKRDIIFDEKNIALLTKGTASLIEKM